MVQNLGTNQEHHYDTDSHLPSTRRQAEPPLLLRQNGMNHPQVRIRIGGESDRGLPKGRFVKQLQCGTGWRIKIQDFGQNQVQEGLIWLKRGFIRGLWIIWSTAASKTIISQKNKTKIGIQQIWTATILSFVWDIEVEAQIELTFIPMEWQFCYSKRNFPRDPRIGKNVCFL